MTVSTYRLTARTGRHIRMATQVTLDDGKVIRFTERMSDTEAIRQVGIQTYYQHLAIARQMDQVAAFQATWTGPRP